MTDWADELAEKVIDESFRRPGSWASENESLVAAALRAAELRGRVKGMKEAAKLVWEVGTGYSDRTKAIADYIESEASQLESSPTT